MVFRTQKILLQRHLRTYLKQEKACEENMEQSNSKFISCQSNTLVDVKPKHICSVCGRMFKFKKGLKKHTEKSHFKILKIWNGKGYDPIVQISLGTKSINKKDIYKTADNGQKQLTAEELGPFNLLGDNSCKN